MTKLCAIMKGFPIARWGHDSAETLHTEIKAKKLAYADLQQYVGDPLATAVPTKALLPRRWPNDAQR